MFSKQELEELFAAWPDENGVSSDPDLIKLWEERESQYFLDKVYLALGQQRLDALSNRQVGFLNRALGRLKSRKSVFEISRQEILGQYELVTEHLSPHSLEVAVHNWKKKCQMQ